MADRWYPEVDDIIQSLPQRRRMPTDEPEAPQTLLDAVMQNIRAEIVRRAARRHRDRHRDVYDALADE